MFTKIILSPAFIPTFSDGPPAIGFTTVMVSFKILNSTPIPSKFPSSGSLTVCSSLAGMYSLCGSKLFKSADKVKSDKESGFILST